MRQNGEGDLSFAIYFDNRNDIGMAEKPTIRALQVFEALATSGGQTLNELTESLPDISRAGIWRALDHLREQKWIRMRKGDKAFVLTTHIDDLMANTPEIPLVLEELDARLPELPAEMEMMVGLFTAPGVFQFVESTHRKFDREPQNLLNCRAALVALMTVSNANMLRHLERWMENGASPDQIQFVKSGKLRPQMLALRQEPVIAQMEKKRCALSFTGSDENVLGIEFTGRMGAESFQRSLGRIRAGLNVDF